MLLSVTQVLEQDAAWYVGAGAGERFLACQGYCFAFELLARVLIWDFHVLAWVLARDVR